MSTFGTKPTSLVAPHMSAFGGKADVPFAPHMSASDPKRTWLAHTFASGPERIMGDTRPVGRLYFASETWCAS
jgi:hypothetical protein